MNKFFSATSKTTIPSASIDLTPDSPLPTEPTMVRVSVHDVDIYEDNPRRFRNNEKYGELRDSILNRGLDTTLQITQRPNATRKILRRGGGTRITIMRECFEITGDYMLHGSIEAMFYPWTGELDIMLGHMTENALHSPLTLFERAHEERLIRAKIIAGDTSVGSEPDEGFAAATLDERVSRYRDLGYPVDKRTLSTYNYIIDRLSPHLEKALKAGIGRPKIEAIKRLEKSTEVMISARDQSVLPEYRAIFERALSESDSSEFTIDAFSETLSRHVSSRLGVDPNNLASKSRGKGTKRRQAKTPASAAGKAKRKPANSVKPTNLDQVAASAGELHSADTEASALGVDEIRERARTIASVLAQEHGLVVSSVYCHEDLALGFAVEQPDPAGISEKDGFIDALVVHRELHSMFWTLLNVDVQLDRIHHGVLGEYTEQSSPRAVLGSNSYHAANQDELYCRLAQMRVTAIADKAKGRESSDRRIAEGLDRLWELAKLYIETTG